MQERTTKRTSLRRILVPIIAAECCILLLLMVWAIRIETAVDTPTADPSAGSMPSQTAAGTISENITVPNKTTVPPESTVGTAYTRAELEAMESDSKTYGPGTTSGGKRPAYAVDLQKKYEQYGANFIAPESNTIYLTFDCGYEYSYQDESGRTVRVTEWILDTLKEKNVKAVFFVTMPYCKSQPDLVQRMIDEGHAVGNHSNNHPSSMADLSIDEMIYEVMSLHDYVKEHFNYEMHLFRPPTGAFSTQSLAVVQSLGYKTVHWSFAYNDWSPQNQPDVTAAYQTITGRHHGGAIYLLHAVSTTNATVLGDVIDYFRTQEYELELFQ